MHFQQHGRTCQLHIATFSDLENVLQLDEAHWVASSAPVAGFHVDPKFLTFLDTDANGRITSDEVKSAIRWYAAHLALSGDAPDSADAIALSAIRADAPEGDALVASAHYVLQHSDCADPQTITLKQIRGFLSSFQSMVLNGDGVIVPEAAEDEETAQFLNTVCAATGGATDASGRKGITGAQLDAFLGAIPGHLEWRERGQASSVLPFGEQTAQLYELYAKHADTVTHYFSLCRLLTFRPDSYAQWQKQLAAGEQAVPPNCEQLQQYLSQFPIAVPQPSGELCLTPDAVNPIYRDWVGDITARILPEILANPGQHLTSSEWVQISQAFAPYREHRATIPGAMLINIATEDLNRFASGKYGENVRALIEKDQKVSAILNQAREVERLLLYRLHLMRFVNNFVSFPQLYSQEERALFEMGSAVIDGRWLNFAVEVDDPARHAAVAKMSSLYVLYLEITGKATEKFYVASPVTWGSKGNLGVGKRGVFFDVTGREYDAKVVQVVENPVSIREALAMPFVRLWRLAEGKLETWSTSAEKDLSKTVNAPTVAAPPTGLPGAALNTGIFGNPAFMGLGVTVAALGSAFAFVTKTFAGLKLAQLVFGFFATALAVMLPVSLIAIVKLRRQDLSSLLESSGWAINARMRLNHAQRRFFTQSRPFPADATGIPRYRRRNILLGILVTLLVVWLGLVLWLLKA